MSTTPELDFDSWLDTGTVAQVDVELHNDKAALIRYREAAELLRDYRAMTAKSGGEQSVADLGEDLDLQAAADEAWAAVEASTETWTLRALSEDEIKAISAAHPAPTMPRQIPDNAPAKSRTEHANKMRAWTEDAMRVREAAQAEQIATAFVSMSTTAGTLTSITPAQILAMKAKPGRLPDFVKLSGAVTDATTNDKAPDAPFWHEPSETDPA